MNFRTLGKLLIAVGLVLFLAGVVAIGQGTPNQPTAEVKSWAEFDRRTTSAMEGAVVREAGLRWARYGAVTLLVGLIVLVSAKKTTNEPYSPGSVQSRAFGPWSRWVLWLASAACLLLVGAAILAVLPTWSGTSRSAGVVTTPGQGPPPVPKAPAKEPRAAPTMTISGPPGPASNDASARRQTGPAAPSRVVVQDVCPGEGCAYGSKLLADSEMRVFATEGDASRVSFKLEQDDTYAMLRGSVHVNEPGRVTLSVRGEGFERGDVLSLLFYEGEGRWRVLHNGRQHTVHQFWNESDLDTAPQAVWWVAIRDDRGRTGWLRYALKGGQRH